ncbi:MAG: hypothetical protein ABIZ80_26080 [Bryobacteraceae bacterium]
MLHVTNGESVQIPETGLPGDVVYWMDVLHEGPVPGALTLEELSEVRAQFIAGLGWGPEEEVLAGFRQRDAGLGRYREHEEVVLWFEHDLFDQLHLLQILDWFSLRDLSTAKLSLICIGDFPGIGRFTGLGQLRPDQLFSLFAGRRPVTRTDLRLAAEGWMAFCSDNPTDLEALLERGTSALPYLKGALVRHLQQFPSTSTGLSRTAQQILISVSSGLKTFADIFQADQGMEERVFLGDAVFRMYLDQLSGGAAPLLETAGERITLTPDGYAVLSGEKDAIALNGIDRWLGGVHLCGADADWRWDDSTRRLVRRS